MGDQITFMVNYINNIHITIESNLHWHKEPLTLTRYASPISRS